MNDKDLEETMRGLDNIMSAREEAARQEGRREAFDEVHTAILAIDSDVDSGNAPEMVAAVLDLVERDVKPEAAQPEAQARELQQRLDAAQQQLDACAAIDADTAALVVELQATSELAEARARQAEQERDDQRQRYERILEENAARLAREVQASLLERDAARQAGYEEACQACTAAVIDMLLYPPGYVGEGSPLWTAIREQVVPALRRGAHLERMPAPTPKGPEPEQRILGGRRAGKTHDAVSWLRESPDHAMLARDTPTTADLVAREGLAVETVRRDGKPTGDLLLRALPEAAPKGGTPEPEHDDNCLCDGCNPQWAEPPAAPLEPVQAAWSKRYHGNASDYEGSVEHDEAKAAAAPQGAGPGWDRSELPHGFYWNESVPGVFEVVMLGTASTAEEAAGMFWERLTSLVLAAPSAPQGAEHDEARGRAWGDGHRAGWNACEEQTQRRAQGAPQGGPATCLECDARRRAARSATHAALHDGPEGGCDACARLYGSSPPHGEPGPSTVEQRLAAHKATEPERLHRWWREIVGTTAVLAAWDRADLSEGQAAAMLGLDRVSARGALDEWRLTQPPHGEPAGEPGTAVTTAPAYVPGYGDRVLVTLPGRVVEVSAGLVMVNVPPGHRWNPDVLVWVPPAAVRPTSDEPGEVE